jgi:TRAP-type mannitol/chloroaromatic compound transport system permease small subunit
VKNEPDPAAEPPSAAVVKNPLLGPANLLAAVGTAWIFVLMLLVVADVVGRNLLDAPITGVAEFAARSVASIVFLQLAAAICTGRMTRSDFLLRMIGRRSPGALKAIEVFNVVVGALLFVALAVIAWPEFTAAFQAAEYFGVQGVYTVPTWPFRLLIVVGSVFAALAYLACIPALMRLPAAGANGVPS